MGDAVIRVEGLGKRYRIWQGERYYALRDVLTRSVGAPLRWLTNGRIGTPAGNADGFVWALKDVCFDVQRGEVVGVIGRNGAGKSTLLKILSRITEPTEGYAEISGRVGSLLDVGAGFHPELTGRENVYLNGAILGMTKKEIDRKFDEIVAFAGVEKFVDTPAKHYSSGMYVRLAFAVAAHLEAEILLVDEVLAVGDLEFQGKCLGKMEEVSSGGRTVLFVGHQMNQVRRLCKRVAWVDGGRVRELGPTAEVMAAYEGAVTSGGPPERTDRDASRVQARFLRWEIVDPPAEKRNLVTSLGPVTVKFVLQVNAPVRMGKLGAALFSSDGQVMWAWATDRLKLEAGTCELRYEFLVLPLRPGTYSWHVSVYEEHDLLDAWYCLPEMIIATEVHQHPADQWKGVLNVPCRFSVNGGG
jgi:lipopolysaccharide transport system ATP-binding protein